MSGYLDNRLFKILIICEVDRFFPGPVQEFLECLEFMFFGARVIIKFIKHDHSAGHNVIDQLVEDLFRGCINIAIDMQESDRSRFQNLFFELWKGVMEHALYQAYVVKNRWHPPLHVNSKSTLRDSNI